MKRNASSRFAAGAWEHGKCSRHVCLAAAVVCGVFGICCLLLAVIGAQKGMVPTDAIAQLFGRPILIRFLDEAILGIPVARFYIGCSLVAGLSGCGLAIHFGKRMRSARRSSAADQA